MKRLPIIYMFKHIMGNLLNYLKFEVLFFKLIIIFYHYKKLNILD